jgi:glycerol-3-phosphate O-acyltransferase/dihydroxyacetone phosphate acyltransferase
MKSGTRSPVATERPEPASSRRIDRAIRALVRLILRVFFRRVEVVGAERIPLGHPMVLVANHVNGLVDPLLILGPLPVWPRLLAKSTLWKNPLVRPWLELERVIPVYRKQDEVDTAQNEATFARCHEVLAEGGAIALFPEGKSHNEPMLQPLKTGLARIVLGAERRFPGLGTRIVPVGLTFDDKGKFRSRALVQVGEPIDPAPEAELDRSDNPAAVRVLTARVSRGLEEVTINYPAWEAAGLIGRAADLYGRAELDVPRGRRLAERFAVHRAFVEGYEEMCRRFPDRVRAVESAVGEYDRLLQTSRLRDDQVASSYTPTPVLRFVARTLLRLLVHLPLAAVGTVLNLLPYYLIRLAAWFVRESPDQVATYKVFGALVLYPLTWLSEAVFAGKQTGSAGLGTLVFLAGPLTGYAALLFHEQRELFWNEARAFLVLRTRRNLAVELKTCRDRVLGEVEALADLYLRSAEQT